MNPFKTYTLEWWQVGILKICMLSLGLAVGTLWPDHFASWVPVLGVIFVVTAIYLTYVRFKQW